MILLTGEQRLSIEARILYFKGMAQLMDIGFNPIDK